MGVKVEKHHHEVFQANMSLECIFGTLTDQADNVQLYKYAVQMVTHSFWKNSYVYAKALKVTTGLNALSPINLER